ncbi:MAG: 30S ribosomal protein S18 [Candidatus Obscuribacterales bacterium]|nr:30S ribosomal protein S18 [Candidatus Obscuribacterales bacterium]
MKPVASGGTDTNSCQVCGGLWQLEYTRPETLTPYLSADGKLQGRNLTGFCEVHQQGLSRAVKRARELGLVPK